MKIGMLFPDYGSQYVGMAKELYDTSRVMQEYFEEASNCLTINFVKLCFASSEAELNIPVNAYTSLFLVSSALAAILKEQSIEPTFVAGCGIGEVSAIHTAKSFSLPDGLYFLSKYAHFYQELLNTHALKALRIKNVSVAQVQKVCLALSQPDKGAFIGIYYDKDDCLISGDADIVMNVKENLMVSHDAQIQEVSFKGGLHSHLMHEVVDHLSMYLEKVDFHDTQIPLIASDDGSLLEKGPFIRDHVVQQICNPIRWDYVIKHVQEWDIIVEIGPGAFFKNDVSAHYPQKTYFTINTQHDIDALVQFVSQEKNKEAA